MILSTETANQIVSISQNYIGRAFDLSSFNCVHFVREVYAQVGIILPLLDPYIFPPREFHLSEGEFSSMPIGHSVFFKRKLSRSTRPWSHVAIIVSTDTVIHCTRNIGTGVVYTLKSIFLETYDLSPIE